MIIISAVFLIIAVRMLYGAGPVWSEDFTNIILQFHCMKGMLSPDTATADLKLRKMMTPVEKLKTAEL